MQVFIQDTKQNVLRDHLDIGDGVLQFGFDNIVQGIHTPICGLDSFIQCEESCLQAGQFYKKLHWSHKCLHVSSSQAQR